MLGVEMHTTIETLFKKGYNKTQIGKILGINGKTVANVLKQLNEKGSVERKQTASILDDFNVFATELLIPFIP